MLRIRGLRPVGWLVASAVLAGCGTSSPAHLGSAVGCSTQGSVAMATTTGYLVVADLGPLAQMFAPNQVPASVPSGAEVMLSGSMVNLGGPDAEHLEVHICHRTTSEVVVAANPKIVFMDATAGTTSEVSVAIMEGVGEGQADLHYGNNVAAPIGHSFVLTVTVGGEQAVLHFSRSA